MLDKPRCRRRSSSAWWRAGDRCTTFLLPLPVATAPQRVATSEWRSFAVTAIRRRGLYGDFASSSGPSRTHHCFQCREGLVVNTLEEIQTLDAVRSDLPRNQNQNQSQNLNGLSHKHPPCPSLHNPMAGWSGAECPVRTIELHTTVNGATPLLVGMSTALSPTMPPPHTDAIWAGAAVRCECRASSPGCMRERGVRLPAVGMVQQH